MEIGFSPRIHLFHRSKGPDGSRKFRQKLLFLFFSFSLVGKCWAQILNLSDDFQIQTTSTNFRGGEKTGSRFFDNVVKLYTESKILPIANMFSSLAFSRRTSRFSQSSGQKQETRTDLLEFSLLRRSEKADFSGFYNDRRTQTEENVFERSTRVRDYALSATVRDAPETVVDFQYHQTQVSFSQPTNSQESKSYSIMGGFNTVVEKIKTGFNTTKSVEESSFSNSETKINVSNFSLRQPVIDSVILSGEVNFRDQDLSGKTFQLQNKQKRMILGLDTYPTRDFFLGANLIKETFDSGAPVINGKKQGEDHSSGQDNLSLISRSSLMRNIDLSLTYQRNLNKTNEEELPNKNLSGSLSTKPSENSTWVLTYSFLEGTLPVTPDFASRVFVAKVLNTSFNWYFSSGLQMELTTGQTVSGYPTFENREDSVGVGLRDSLSPKVNWGVNYRIGKSRNSTGRDDVRRGNKQLNADIQIPITLAWRFTYTLSNVMYEDPDGYLYVPTSNFDLTYNLSGYTQVLFGFHGNDSDPETNKKMGPPPKVKSWTTVLNIHHRLSENADSQITYSSVSNKYGPVEANRTIGATLRNVF